MFKTKRLRRPGFSLIQLIVLMLILAAAAGIVVAGIWRIRENEARACECSGSLKQIAMAVLNAHDTNKSIPPFSGKFGGKDFGTFHYHLLPYLDNAPLWKAPDADAMVPQFLSPHDPTRADCGKGATNFTVNLRLFYSNGGLGELQTGKDLVYLKWHKVADGDGLSNTLLLATKYQFCGTNGGSMWLDPGNNLPNSFTAATFGTSMSLWQNAPSQAKCDPGVGTAVSLAPDMISVAMCDASVNQISTRVSQATWQALHTFAGKDQVESNWDEWRH